MDFYLKWQQRFRLFLHVQVLICYTSGDGFHFYLKCNSASQANG
jgi:hypothetical protein